MALSVLHTTQSAVPDDAVPGEIGPSEWNAAHTISGTLDVIATGGTTARTLEAHFADILNAKDFGAVGDGVTDDTAALTAWLAALTTGSVGRLPAGTYLFTGALAKASGDKFAIIGDGAYQSVLLYAGASTTADLLTIGDGSGGRGGITLSNFKIDSTTTMTSGNALHLRRLARCFIDNVVVSGQDGNHLLWDGIFFNGADTVTLSGFDIETLNDGVKVCGATTKADLFISNGKITHCGRCGILIGGDFGGFYIDAADIIGNTSHGVRIDTSLNATGNREVFFGPGCFIDSNGGAGVYFDNGLKGDSYVSFSGTWISSNTTHGIAVSSTETATSRIQVVGGTIYNNTNDGINIASTGPAVCVDGALIRNNGGWGINNAGAGTNARVGLNYFIANTSGSVTGTSFTTAETGVFKSVNPVDSASVETGRFVGARATPATNDTNFQSYYLNSSTGVAREVYRQNVRLTSVTNAAETGQVFWGLISGGSFANRMQLTPAQLGPVSNDGLSLGTATGSWSDLFLASGGVVNWNNGDVTVTHSSNLLAFAGASSGYSFDSSLILSGATSGSVTIAVPATAGSNTLTLPAGTTNFSATGGTSQVVKQTTAGGAFTVATVAASEIVSGAALTKTDDTNVTLTLGGSPTTALLSAASMTLGWTGTLAAARLNSNVVQSVVNDTNITGSITTQALTLGWTGTLALSRLAQGTDGQLIVGQTSASSLYKSITGDWTLSAAGAATLATVNSNVGTFGSATKASVVTVNAKGLVTAASESTVTPDIGSITGLGTGVATWLATPSSANLAAAVTDETGTGVLVFGTSPGFTTAINPVSDDGAALGTTSLQWSDLFLASGAVINWNSSDVTLTHSTNLLAFAGATSGYTFDSAIVIGTTALLATVDSTGSAVTPNLQEHAAAAPGSSQFIARWAASTAPPRLILGKSRGAVATHTVVQSGDGAGEIIWVASDGTDFAPVAMIKAEIDGTPGNNDMPGRIVFATTADGANSSTARLVLDSTGVLKPNANDGVALGTTALGFSDLFLATGGVINWNNGEVTLTETDANTLTLAGATTVFDVQGPIQVDSLRIDQTPTAVGTGTKTISNAADSSTNFGHYISFNANGTTYYIPCSSVALT